MKHYTLIKLMLALVLVPLADIAWSSTSRPTPYHANNKDQCNAGTYYMADNKLCYYALTGHYVPTAGMTDDIPCPKGKYQPNFGATECLNAQPGHFVSREGRPRHMPCDLGKYQDKSGASRCKKAPPGYFVSGPGARSPEECPVNTFSMGQGATGCTKCSAGYGTNGKTGSTSRSDCEEIQYTSPEDYYHGHGHGAPGTGGKKGNSPHKCKPGKNWKTKKQACK